MRPRQAPLLALTILTIVLLPIRADAQSASWSGFYLGGLIGYSWQADDAGEVVLFDTALDGSFGDVVRTTGGADAFSPGFCGGAAASATPAGGCGEDEDGIDAGGRFGYDRQIGMVLVGGVVDLSWADVSDGVSAFSTTPASYTFTRTLEMLAGVRGRIGIGGERMMAYGTGGIAWGWVEQRFSSSNTVNRFVAISRDDSDTQRADGYQAGGGVEFRLGERVGLGAEYLFTSLDDRDDAVIRAQGPAPATNPFILVNGQGTDLRRSERFDIQSLRLTLSYRF